MSTPPLSAEGLHQLLWERCAGNPFNSEWGDIYPVVCRGIAHLGMDLSPQWKVHQLPVMVAAVHYMRETFQSEGSFWDGFTSDIGFDNRPLLFSTLYQWLDQNGKMVSGQRREVVKTLLFHTGVPAHWSRDFADFFIWFFRNRRSDSAAVAWSDYPNRRQMPGRENSFIPAADKLKLVFQHLMDNGIDPDSNPADVYDMVAEELGPEYDPRRLVRRQDSFSRLWLQLFERMTPGQFRRWLHRRPSCWITTPDQRVEAARHVYMSDDIQYGTYTCNEDQVDVVPHAKVSLIRVIHEWPDQTPWLGLPGHVGFRSGQPFDIRHNGEVIAASRPLRHDGVNTHVALTPIPLGGELRLPSGVVPGRDGYDFSPPRLWLQRQADDFGLYLVVPHTRVAWPNTSLGFVNLEARQNGLLLGQQRTQLDQRGMLELYDWIVPLPNPTAGDVHTELIVAGERLAERITTLAPALLFSLSGDQVTPHKRAATFGERRYILFLAEGEPPPEFDSADIKLEWFETGSGAYRIANVRWVQGRFRLRSDGSTWAFDRGLETDLWVNCLPMVAQQQKQVQLVLPPNALDSLEQVELRLATNGDIEEGQLRLHIFCNNMPLDDMTIRSQDLVSSGRSGSGRITWEFSSEFLGYLRMVMREPGMYDLALSTSNSIVSRARVYLLPKVRMQSKVPGSAEGSRVIAQVQADRPALLRQDGEIVSALDLVVPYRVHEVPDASTGVRCIPEAHELSLTFGRPQITATLKVSPVVCGIRPLVRQEGKWAKASRPDFQDLSRAGIYVFGPAHAQADLTTNDGQLLARVRLDSEGNGLFDQLSGLVAYCLTPVTHFKVQIGSTQLPYAVNRSPVYRNVQYESAVANTEQFTCSLQVTGPVATKVAVLLSAPEHEVVIHESVLDGSSKWQSIRGTLPGATLGASQLWRLVLTLGDRRHLLGKIWNMDLVSGGIGERADIPASDLPTVAVEETERWLKRGGASPLVVWAPVGKIRDRCEETISTTFSEMAVYASNDSGGLTSITEDLLFPMRAFLKEGIGIPETLPPEAAIHHLIGLPAPPMLVRDAHLLSTFERSILRQLKQPVLLVSANPFRI